MAENAPLIDINNLAANGALKTAPVVPKVPEPVIDQTKTMPDATKARMFYSRLDGNTFIFPWGKVARFENGAYETDIEEEIAELAKMCANYKAGKQFEINDEPLPVLKSTAVIMREVGGGRGAVNSGGISNMANRS